MTTRKQKHQAAVEKRERFMAEERRRNAEVLRQEKEKRARKHREMWQEKHDNAHSWKKIDNNCPHCQDRLRAQKSEAAKRERETREMMANA